MRYFAAAKDRSFASASFGYGPGFQQLIIPYREQDRERFSEAMDTAVQWAQRREIAQSMKPKKEPTWHRAKRTRCTRCNGRREYISAKTHKKISCPVCVRRTDDAT